MDTMVWGEGALREAAKKSVFFIGPATKRGRGVRAWPLRKNTFFEALKKILENMLWPLSSRGRGGGKASMASALK